MSRDYSTENLKMKIFLPETIYGIFVDDSHGAIK